MPIFVFLVACLLKIEKFTLAMFGVMLMIAAGVGLTSYGELRFSYVGTVCMFSAMLCEAFRLTLIQILLQQQDLQMNPLSTMSYIMPISMFFVMPIAYISEAKALWGCSWPMRNSLPLLCANAVSAVALNLSIYAVIGKTSALTMKIAALVKDIALVAISCSVFGDALTEIGVGGYVLALMGIVMYSYYATLAPKGIFGMKGPIVAKNVKCEEKLPTAFVKEWQTAANK